MGGREGKAKGGGNVNDNCIRVKSRENARVDRMETR